MNTGLIYIAFGEKAAKEAEKSIASFRDVGEKSPAVVVGDIAVKGAESIKWIGESPFDGTRAKGLQFRAGRIKPFLHKLSPFEKTLYVDCDTVARKSISSAWGLLDYYDFLFTKHPGQSLAQLYNRPNAGWFHNIRERDATIQEWGDNGNVPYWNSGVVFFRNTPEVEKVFSAWYIEWLRYKEWDEQQALMRASFGNPCRILVLPECWNYPHDGKDDTIIFHFYGRGIARTNVR